MKNRKIYNLVFGIVIWLCCSVTCFASPKVYKDGTVFDAEYYAKKNPDVVAVVGNDETALLNHYRTCGIAEGRQGVKTSEEASYELAEEMLPMINAARNTNGLGNLTLNKALCDVAYIRAKEMYDNRYLEHCRPDGSDISGIIEAAVNNHNCYLGENIAMGFYSSERVMNGWMNSPGHRYNILYNHYTSVGVGTFDSYWVQVFYGP